MKEEYLNVRLERKDVINLIRSTYPPYEDIEMLENLKLGYSMMNLMNNYNSFNLALFNVKIYNSRLLLTPLQCGLRL